MFFPLDFEKLPQTLHRLKAKFLVGSSTDIWGHFVICWGDCLVHGTMLSRIGGLYPPDANSIPNFPVLTPKKVPRHHLGGKTALLESHWLTESESHDQNKQEAVFAAPSHRTNPSWGGGWRCGGRACLPRDLSQDSWLFRGSRKREKAINVNSGVRKH